MTKKSKQSHGAITRKRRTPKGRARALAAIARLARRRPTSEPFTFPPEKPIQLGKRKNPGKDALKLKAILETAERWQAKMERFGKSEAAARGRKEAAPLTKKALRDAKHEVMRKGLFALAIQMPHAWRKWSNDDIIDKLWEDPARFFKDDGLPYSAPAQFRSVAHTVLGLEYPNRKTS